MAYDNTNKGTLGRNKRKTEETHPTHTGKINVEGVEYWLSAWVKKNAETGEQFFSLALKPKDEKKPQAHEPGAAADLDDDIPF